MRAASFRLLAFGFLAGLFLQVAVLPFRGTGDVHTFKQWAVSVHEHGVLAAYARPSGPAERWVMPDYPPLSVVALAATAAAHDTLWGAPETDAPTLTVGVKAWTLLARLATFLAVFRIVRISTGDPRLGLTAATALWLNPALWLNGPVLGYLDPLCWVFGMAALWCVASNRLPSAAGLAVCALMIKPQGVFFLLPVAAAAASQPAVRLRTVAAAGLAAVILTGPFIVTGGVSAFADAMAVNLFDDNLSGQSFNLWWIATAGHHLAEHGASALAVPLTWMRESDFAAATGVRPRMLMALVVAAVALGVGRAVRGRCDVPVHAAYLAFVFHVYVVVAVSVHENHQVYCVVVLALLAWLVPAYTPLLAAVTALTATNLMLFHLPDWGVLGPPQTGWFLPVTVVLSAANIALLVPHARLLARTIRPADQGAYVPTTSA